MPDYDAAYRRAIEEGATSMGEPADRPFGEPSGFVKDFVGNHWYIAMGFDSFDSNVAPEGLGTLVAFPPARRAII